MVCHARECLYRVFFVTLCSACTGCSLSHSVLPVQGVLCHTLYRLYRVFFVTTVLLVVIHAVLHLTLCCHELLLTFLIDPARVGPRSRRGCLVLSWNHSKSTPCLLARHKRRHTNRHAAASLAFKFSPAPLGVTHDASATRPATRPATSTTAPPCPSPTRRARGKGRAIAREAVFESRIGVVASSSVVRLDITGTALNATTARKRRGPYRTATRGGVPERSESGDLKTCLVAYSRCDAAAGRPGGCEHFSCLGSTCNL